METSLKLQLDVRNNAQELTNYILDLNNWEEEMKRKEMSLNNEKPQESSFPPPRNKINKNNEGGEKKPEKPKKINAYDYSAWDKFDAEKACAELDEDDKLEKKPGKEVKNETMPEKVVNENENEVKNHKLSLIDEAFYEKEMGNQFVKKEQWTEAITCYTNAINLDPKNPIFYANRSLCFFKLKDFKSAETDATISIQLDQKYVKAYQRRAYARLALGQHLEAKLDFEEILKLEPKNSLSRFEINKIEENCKSIKKTSPSEKKTFDPKNMFKAKTSKTENVKSVNPVVCQVESMQKKKLASTPVPSEESDNKRSVVQRNLKNEKVIIEEKGDGDKFTTMKFSESNVFKSLPQWCNVINPVNVPPHRRSKKPLKRIDIKNVDNHENDSNVEKTKELILERDKEVNLIGQKLYNDKTLSNEKLLLEVPKTAIQFQNSWKIIKNDPKKCYNYLKQIPGKDLPEIFKNSLESDFFSELITLIAKDDIKKEPEVVYDFIKGLTKVKRFSSLIMFMSEEDKNCIRKCITELKNFKSEEEISNLTELFELKKI